MDRIKYYGLLYTVYAVLSNERVIIHTPTKLLYDFHVANLKYNHSFNLY